MITERIKKWAEANACFIDEKGLHVYKAVHKVPYGDGFRYIPHFGVHFCKEYVFPDLKHMCENTIEYEFGKTISIDSNKFEIDPFKECGFGLHASGIEYAKHFGATWGDGVVIELVIDINDPSTKLVIPYDVDFVRKTYAETCFGEYRYELVGVKTTAPKIRATKMTPIREVCKCYYTDLNPENKHHYEPSWYFVFKILDLKKEIDECERLMRDFTKEEYFKLIHKSCELKELRDQLERMIMLINELMFTF